jgi:hypothetical protein
MPDITIEKRFARIVQLLSTEPTPPAVKREISELIAAVIDHCGASLGH